MTADTSRSLLAHHDMTSLIHESELTRKSVEVNVGQAPRDEPVFFAENDEAMVFLAKTLEQKGLVSLRWTSDTVDVTLT